MHLHDLKNLIALLVLIASVIHTSCLVDISTRYNLDEVADFDDIVEVDNEKDKVIFEEQLSKNPDIVVPVEEGLDPFQIPLIEPSSRVKTDVRGVQSKLQNSPYLINPTHHSTQQYEASRGVTTRPKEKLNIFESPLIYEIQDDIPHQGYFLVKQRKPKDQQHNENFRKHLHEIENSDGGYQIIDSNVLNTGSNFDRDSQRLDNIEGEKMEQNSKIKLNPDLGSNSGKSDKLCVQFFEIFHRIPQIMKQLDSTDSPNTWKSIKYIIREQHPNFAKNGILDRPESKNCYRKFIRRRKRHSTYINFRNRKRKFNNLQVKRNAPYDPRFKNIIDFIIKNKSFQSNYTYVPVFFATVKNVDLNRLETSSDQLTSANPITPVNNPISIGTTSADKNRVQPTIPYSENSVPKGENSASTVLLMVNEAKNLTDELSFRIPKLRQSFQDIIDTMKEETTPRRIKKEVSVMMGSNDVPDGITIESTRKDDPVPMSPNDAAVSAPPPHDPKINLEGDNPSNLISKAAVVNSVSTSLSNSAPVTIVNFIQHSESVNPSNSMSDHIQFPSESHFNITINISTKSGNKVENFEFNLPTQEPDKKSDTENISLGSTKESNNVTSMFSSVGDVIPGVLIYPVNSEKSNNNRKRGIQVNEGFPAEDKIGVNSYFTIEEPYLSANEKYIDFNPLPKLKKEASNDCQNETEEMLNVLKSLNMRVPDDIDNTKDKYGSEQTIATSPMSTSVSEITSEPSENTNIIDFNTLPNINFDSLMEANSNNLMKPAANDNKIKTFNLFNDKSTTEPLFATSMPSENEIILPISYMSPSANEDTFSTIAFTPSAIVKDVASETTVSATPITAPEILSITVSETPTTVSEKPITIFETPTTVSEIPTAISETPRISTKSSMSYSTTIMPENSGEAAHNPLIRQRNKAEKLKKLETDLKLVNEVQNILNGMNSLSHDMKKRELPLYQANCSSENDPIFELNFKVVSSSSESNKEKEVNELGKILQWRDKTAKCRRRRLSKSKRKKKKMKKRRGKPHRMHRFLGQRIQNCL